MLSTVISSAQSPITSTAANGAISGVVTDGMTGKPVSDAIVTLGTINAREYSDSRESQFTDPKGRFVFADLPTGAEYAVQVTKAGYFDGAYGRQVGGTFGFVRIVLATDQWFPTANVTLWRPGGIAGTVTDERGEPVVGALVRTLASIQVIGRTEWATGPPTTTDDRGAYRIGSLPPGRYVVEVPSVQSSVAKTDAPANTPTGRIGSPNNPAAVDTGSNARLVVGPYPTPPSPANGRPRAYPAAFSGGPTLTAAMPTEVRAGQDVDGVDIRLSPVPTATIAGHIEGQADAGPGLALRLIAEGLEHLGAGSEAATAVVAPDRSFEFTNVPAGNYVIQAAVAFGEYTFGSSPLAMFYGPQVPFAPGVTATSTIGSIVERSVGQVNLTATTLRAARVFGQATVALGGSDVRDVVVSLHSVSSVSGRLVAAADPSRPAPQDPPRFVDLESADGDPQLGRLSSATSLNMPAGEFRIDGVPPGAYLVRSSDTNWMIKSITVDGRDFTNMPFEMTSGQNLSDVVVTFTNAFASLEGTARDTTGTPVPGGVVVVFPAEREQWARTGTRPTRIKRVQASSAGSYRLSRLPAGAYEVIALSPDQSDAWAEAGFFDRAEPMATRVTIAWGEKKQQDLKLTEWRK